LPALVLLSVADNLYLSETSATFLQKVL